MVVSDGVAAALDCVVVVACRVVVVCVCGAAVVVCFVRLLPGGRVRTGGGRTRGAFVVIVFGGGGGDSASSPEPEMNEVDAIQLVSVNKPSTKSSSSLGTLRKTRNADDCAVSNNVSSSCNDCGVTIVNDTTVSSRPIRYFMMVVNNVVRLG
jgi:hypothetical protein